MTKIHLHLYDLPQSVKFTGPVAVDCEMLGLRVGRDRLCLVQLRDEAGEPHLVHFPEPKYNAPNLRAILDNRDVVKIFHFGQTDIAYLNHYLGAVTSPIFDTKIAAKLARRNVDKHGLEDLCKDLLGIELSKAAQSSDWGAATLSDAQKHYAARDVLHLHDLRDKLTALLSREGLLVLAELAFINVTHNGMLEAAGFNPNAVFAHSSAERV
jgi:ribonuclease D